MSRITEKIKIQNPCESEKPKNRLIAAIQLFTFNLKLTLQNGIFRSLAIAFSMSFFALRTQCSMTTTTTINFRIFHRFWQQSVERENVAKVCVSFLVAYDTQFSLITQYISSMLILTPKKINFFLLTHSLLSSSSSSTPSSTVYGGGEEEKLGGRGGWTDEKSFYVWRVSVSVCVCGRRENIFSISTLRSSLISPLFLSFILYVVAII